MRENDLILDWYGCYGGNGWKGHVVPETFHHPAKYSRKLVWRIFDEATRLGWLPPGATILDPFGGVALGALPALMHGYSWFGVEVEPRFVGIGNRNIEMWNGLYRNVLPMWTGSATLVQGDSRKLAAVLSEAGGLVGSPPYAGNNKSDHTHERRDSRRLGDGYTGRGRGSFRGSENYGNVAGQIGVLSDGDFEGVVSSPPFLEGRESKRVDSTVAKDQRVGGATEHRKEAYGATPGQIGAMAQGELEAVLSSPPYNLPMSQDHNGKRGGKRGDTQSERGAFCRYGNQAGQIEGLPSGNFDNIISSPPYEGSEIRGGAVDQTAWKDGRSRNVGPSHDSYGYGSGDGQIGCLAGTTFWEASRDIVDQCYQVLRPGAYTLWVVKRFVRKNEIVDFSDQWRRLCESRGFVFICDVRAWFVKRGPGQLMLDGGIEENVRENKSFFRRLTEKRGAPHIDWEDVLVMRKLPLDKISIS